MMNFIKPDRRVHVVFLHCSASDNPQHDDVSVIRSWHVQKGWSDVGYHFFIKKDGDIQKGRDLEKVPAAQQGYNAGSIAICLHGLREENFTANQFESLKDLCIAINKAYNRRIWFKGHCEVNSKKSCPVFKYKVVLGLDEDGYMT